MTRDRRRGARRPRRHRDPHADPLPATGRSPRAPASRRRCPASHNAFAYVFSGEARSAPTAAPSRDGADGAPRHRATPSGSPCAAGRRGAGPAAADRRRPLREPVARYGPVRHEHRGRDPAGDRGLPGRPARRDPGADAISGAGRFLTGCITILYQGKEARWHSPGSRASTRRPSPRGATRARCPCGDTLAWNVREGQAVVSVHTRSSPGAADSPGSSMPWKPSGYRARCGREPRGRPDDAGASRYQRRPLLRHRPQPCAAGEGRPPPRTGGRRDRASCAPSNGGR